MKRKLLILSIAIGLLIPEAGGQEMNSQKQGISLGYDFSGLIIYAFQPTQLGGGVSISAGAFKKFYYTFEAGLLKINDKEDLFTYNSNGQYLKFGFDYNFYKKKTPEENNMVFIGFRYGLSKLNHSAKNIKIEDNKWGNYIVSSIPESNVNAQWIEFVGGIRVELLRNFSMGWSGRVHFITHTTGITKPLVIPGYGNGYSNTTVGFNYSIYYTIPLRKYKK